MTERSTRSGKLIKSVNDWEKTERSTPNGTDQIFNDERKFII